MKNVLVDRKNCIACGNCTHVCSEVFSIQDGASLPDNTQMREDLVSAVDTAIRQCPVQVISWEGDANRSEAAPSTGGIFSFFSRLFGSEGKEMKSDTLVFLDSKDLTSSVSVFTFQSPHIAFIPGQYLTIKLSDAEGDFWRAYSIFSGDAETISFCIRLSDTGRGARFLREKLQKGVQIPFKGPKGEFLLRSTPKEKIFVVTGTGVSPVFSMLKSLSPQVPARLYFGLLNEDDIFLKKELEAFPNLNITFALSDAKTDAFFKGRVTDIIRDGDWNENQEFYLCGNPHMIDDARKLLMEKGIPNENVVFEHFS
ncbi:MAG: ferredoxin [Candidatus Peregrinibacteria bacterium]